MSVGSVRSSKEQSLEQRFCEELPSKVSLRAIMIGGSVKNFKEVVLERGSVRSSTKGNLGTLSWKGALCLKT